MKRLLASFLSGLLLGSVLAIPVAGATAKATENAAPTVLPAIRQWTGGNGKFIPKGGVTLANPDSSPAVEKVQGYFAEMLSMEAVVTLEDEGDVIFLKDDTLLETVGEEGYTLEASVDGETWFTLIDRRDSTDDLPHDYVQLDEMTSLRYLKLTNHGEVPAGGKFAVSGLRVFGYGGGTAPASAPEFTATRGEDTRNMTVTWKPVEGAQGYFIRWGIDPHNLHTHWQVVPDRVIGDCEATVYCLTKGVTYYVTVDAYNESGVTCGTQIQTI